MNITSVVFIDGRLPENETLTAALGADTAWFVLDAGRDGVQQMQEILQAYTGLGSIQVLSHGTSGALYLGSMVLDSSTLASYQGALQDIGTRLADGGDLLLYGCNVAEGAEGRAFVETLAELMGADVAASDDLTGLNGDWVLEVASGRIEAEGLDVQTYGATLSVIKGTEGDDTLTGDGLGNTLFGYGGADLIDGEAGPDLIYGGSGNDTLDGNFGNDTVYGEAGDDVLTDSQGSNWLDGGEGNDQLTVQALTGQHTLVGGLGDDTLDATGQTLLLDGGEGSDYLNATGCIHAGGVESWVQNGSATLVGGDSGGYLTQNYEWNDSGYIVTDVFVEGTDHLSASYLGNALLQGGAGRDALYVNATRNATLEGGAGQDELQANVNGWYGVDRTGAGFGTNYRLDGGADDDALTVTGYSYSWYGLTDLSLEGGTGNDTLSVGDAAFGNGNGAVADATLSGGDGDDRMTASGVLRLTMTGGSGTDTFVLTAQQYKATQASYQFQTQQSTEENNWDQGNVTVAGKPIEITDFVAGRDGEKLDIRDLLQNGATNYDGTNPFKSGHLAIEQAGADTLLKFDTDGHGDNLVTLAVLRGVKGTDLVAKNFSPLFGTPNGDIMSGLKGGQKHEGIGGNDMLLGFALPDENATTVSNWETLLESAELTDEDLVLDGGEGADTMVGGVGDNTYYVDHVGDVVRQVAGGGSATVIAAIDYALGEHLDELVVADDAASGTKGLGNALDNILRANDKGSELHGVGGNNQLLGGIGHDKLIGGTGKDKLKGGSGDDYVDAGAGDDEIVGGDGAGDDTYLGGDGIDTVRYTSAIDTITVDLAAGTASGVDIGNDVLTGIENIIGGQAGDVLTGDAKDNAIEGFSGNDTIYGSGGTDSAVYRGARSEYSVTSNTDGSHTVTDSVAGRDGVDRLFSIEKLVFSDEALALVTTSRSNTAPTGAVTITGTATQGQTLTAANTLADVDGLGTIAYQWKANGSVISGATASSFRLTQAEVGKAITVTASYTDGQGTVESKTSAASSGVLSAVIQGTSANDSLAGTAGADSVAGGLGNDIYVVNHLGDVVIEKAGEGSDVVRSSITHTLAANVEHLQLLGSTAIHGTGNSLANRLTGNGAANVLKGGSGNDTVSGASGNDTLYGNAGNDSLVGGTGIDKLVGGTGNDLYVVNLTAAGKLEDTIVETSTLATEIDTLKLAGTSTNTTAATISLSASSLVNIERLDASATGTSKLNLTGNANANVLTGNGAANVIRGGSGNDTVSGGSGNDKLYGDAGADSLVGGSGADSLVGGTGIDKLVGGTGNDLYVVNLTAAGKLEDTIVETSTVSTEIDTLKLAGGSTNTTAVTISLSTSGLVNIERLDASATGTSKLNLTGNTKANLLTGNGAANVIRGGSGNDTVSGGSGNDTLYGDAGNDSLVGGSGNDKLIGGAGKDVLTGGAGNDVFDFNALSEMGGTISTRDIIKDFARGYDRIDLSTLDANASTTTNDAFSSKLVSSFTAAGQLKFASGVLYGNTDADATAEFAIELTGVTSLSATDLIL